MSEPTNSEKESVASHFDPHTAFLDLIIVRKTVAFILGSAILIATLIFILNRISGEWEWNASPSGLNFMLEVFKIPLGLLAISIPALALLAANHRSEQTKAQMQLTLKQIARTDKQITRTEDQIKLTREQNIFSNFYKHIEEFDKKCLDIQGKYVIESSRKLHTLIFPKAQRGELTASTSAIASFKADIETLINISKKCNNKNGEIIFPELQEEIHRVEKKYYLSVKPKISKVKNDDLDEWSLTNLTHMKYVKEYNELFNLLNQAFEFDITYTTPIPLRLLNLINVAEMAKGPMVGHFHMIGQLTDAEDRMDNPFVRSRAGLE